VALRKRPVLACGVQFEQQLKAGMSVTEIPEIARRAGVDGVEFREVYWKDKAAELPVVRDKMRSLGLLTTYATFTTLVNAEPAAREQLLGDIGDAHALGSPLLRVFRGPWPEGPDRDEMWQGARRAIARAEANGQRLALENFARVPGNHRHEVEAALAELDTPTVCTNIDTANYVNNGEDLIANIEALHRYIGYAHLKDVRKVPGAENRVVPLGEGELPFDRIFALFDATGRDFPVTLEHGGGDDPERAIATSLEHLRKLGMAG
jgi:sugar phosphate isomerase/epimerase